MPWIEARLRGQKVLARARPDGSLAAEGGRVEIRYKPTDARAYRASAANLVAVEGAPLLPEDAVVPGQAVGPAKAKGKATEHKTERAHWTAYTDGACSGNPGPAGAGMIVIAPDGKIHEGYEYVGPSSTNNVAELTAIQRAVEAIPVDAESVVVHTDSKYAIGVLTLGWKAKANAELIATIRSVLKTHKMQPRFVYVPGHAGVPMNERADELAREAIRMGRSQPLPRLGSS